MVQRGFRRVWLRRGSLALIFAIIFSFSPGAIADPIVDFFRKLGHPRVQTNQKSQRTARGRNSKSAVPNQPQSAAQPNENPAQPIAAEATATIPPRAPQTPAPTTPTTPTPVVRAAAINPETHGSARDIPFAIPVPNRPGFVTSPYAPNQGFVDVRGFRSGTEVKDPYTGKFFLTP